MKIEEYLRENGVSFRHHKHNPVYTAQELAAEEHVPGRDVAKAVVVKAGDQYVMCVLPACFKLDLGKVAGILEVDQCRLADESEMAKLFPDVAVGAEPPFGHLYNMTTLVDTHFIAEDAIIFAADSHRDAIEMAYTDYAKLANPRVADVSVHA